MDVGLRPTYLRCTTVLYRKPIHGSGTESGRGRQANDRLMGRWGPDLDNFLEVGVKTGEVDVALAHLEIVIHQLLDHTLKVVLLLAQSLLRYISLREKFRQAIDDSGHLLDDVERVEQKCLKLVKLLD